MRIAIAGAGLAGLAAACELADAGHAVTLLDRRPWAGGKTYSFADRGDTVILSEAKNLCEPRRRPAPSPSLGEQVDNGQHIAMRCTTEYVRFLDRIGSAHLLRWQRRMSVPVIDASGRRSELRADPLPAGMHMLPSFALYRHLSLADKARVARGIIAVRSARRDQARGISFEAWLRAHGQTPRTVAAFWDLIVVPALNARCADASAEQALFVFQEGFLASAQSAAVGVPRVGLSELHVEPALRYIRARGGELRTGAAAERIELDAGAVRALVLADGERIVCDACIVALPPRETRELLAHDARLSPLRDTLGAFRMSPIVNLHLWFDAPVADFEFAAFTGCDLQWVFRSRIAGASGGAEHLVVSLSAAERYMPLDKSELLALLLPQLHRALPRTAAASLLRAAMIKEPEATFVPAPGLRRPGARTAIAGLYLAGAHTDTGWPATMESAVRSGLAAARAAIDDARNVTPRPLATAVEVA